MVEVEAKTLSCVDMVEMELIAKTSISPGMIFRNWNVCKIRCGYT